MILEEIKMGNVCVWKLRLVYKSFWQEDLYKAFVIAKD